MPRPLFDRMCEWLRLTPGECRWLWLVHQLLHADPEIQEYVRTLEAHQWNLDVCDERLEKLGSLVSDLRQQRASIRAQPPVSLAGDQPPTGILLSRRSTPTDDEETADDR